MSRLTELEKDPDHEEWVWPCDCHHSGHYVRITWDADDPAWRYLWVEHGVHPSSWRDRVADAWRVLRGGSCVIGEVVLAEAAIQDLRRFVDLHVSPGEDRS